MARAGHTLNLFGEFAIPPRLVGSPMVEHISLKYSAFISNSHADTSWAKWLQQRLSSSENARTLVLSYPDGVRIKMSAYGT